MGVPVSAKTIERVVHDVGGELAAAARRRPQERRRLGPAVRESPPQLAVVECDGGRIRTREPGHGPGRASHRGRLAEDKNACLIRACERVSADDPQPEPPACFCDPKHVAKIAETEALSVAAVVARERPRARPTRTRSVRPPPPDGVAAQTPGSHRAEQPGRRPRTFGNQMAREAKRRRFFEAKAKAFLGDGLPWNWSIWKQHFADFTPILDFIHVLSYLFVAAKAVHARAAGRWDQYLAWMRGCWQRRGRAGARGASPLADQAGAPPEDASENDPRAIVAKTITYLENNQARMNYPEYRRQGLPVTTAWMESLVKEINYRVKGTEMFWNDPEGPRRSSKCEPRRSERRRPTGPAPPDPTRLPLHPPTQITQSSRIKKSEADVHPSIRHETS